MNGSSASAAVADGKRGKRQERAVLRHDGSDRSVRDVWSLTGVRLHCERMDITRTNTKSSHPSGRPSPLVCTKPRADAGMFAACGSATGSLVQIKQADKTGRPDIDKSEAVLARDNRDCGFFVSFGYTSRRRDRGGVLLRRKSAASSSS